MVKTKSHFLEIGKDLFTYGLTSVLSQMSGLLLLPVLTRVFSVNEYGVVDIIAAFVSLVATFLRFALPSAVSRFFDGIPNSKERKQFVSTLLVFIACAGLLIVFGISLFSDELAKMLLGEEGYSLFVRLGCWIALLNGLLSIPQMILRMERKIVIFSLTEFISAIIYLALSLYFVVALKSGVGGVFVAQIIGAAVSLLVALLCIHRYMTYNLSIYHLRRALKFSLPLLPAILVTWINSQIDRLLLLFLTGLGGVAFFGAASKIAKVSQVLGFIFRKAWQPYSMLIINSPDRNEVYRRILNYYAGTFACLGLMLTAISPEVFTLFLPKEYYFGYRLIPWLVGAAVLHHSSSITGLGMLVSERTAGISIASWIGVGLNIGISLPLIWLFGLMGAAIGTFVAELCFTSLLWRYSELKSDVRFEKKVSLIVILYYIVGAFLLLIVSEIITNPLSTILRVAILLVVSSLIVYQVVDGSVLQFLKVLSKRFRLVIDRRGSHMK